MRYLLMIMVILGGINIAPSFAQDSPERVIRQAPKLYNSGQGNNYRASGGIKPLSLQSILRGSSSTGYEYSRTGTGYRTYDLNSSKGSYQEEYSNSNIPTFSDIELFRKRQAQQAQENARESRKEFSSYNQSGQSRQAQTQRYLDQFGGGSSIDSSLQPVYNGRKTGITLPTRSFGRLP